MKTTIQAVKGTRDFYPDLMNVRTWLYTTMRQVAESFGYQEYEGPVLERIDLYAAKSGEELVKEQAFVFQDRGGDMVTLRPELTPTLARMVAQKQNELPFPLRWWSFGPFWRYERPQKGRSREFLQWNVDLIGANTPEADAELVAVCATFFKKVGLNPQQVKILVNNRRLMDAELAKLGITAEQKKFVFHLVDRRDKMPPAEWEKYALENGLSIEQFAGLKSLLADTEAWQRSTELQRFFAAMQAMGLEEFVHYDPQIIRGLDYYTGTVFEARDQDGGRSLFGGGRYDNLVSDVGGDALAGVGFAMGDVMMTLVLQKYQCIPALTAAAEQVLVSVFDEAHLASAMALANELRRAGIKTVCYPEAAKLPKQFKYADRVGIRYVVVVGPDEEAARQATVKDLRERSQQSLPRAELADRLKEMLAQK